MHHRSLPTVILQVYIFKDSEMAVVRSFTDNAFIDIVQ